MSLTQYYTATALDGFIADPDNSLEWLFRRAREADGPLNYGDFIADVGALAMGSTTYEWILDHEFADKDPAEWKWPHDIPCWVLTHRRLPVVPDARRVHERGRRHRARGDGRCRRWAERLDRRRRGPGRPVRRCRSLGRGDRLHRAGDAGWWRASAAAPDRAAPRRARTKRRLRMRQVLGRAPVRLTGPAGFRTRCRCSQRASVASHVLQALGVPMAGHHDRSGVTLAA